MTFLEDSNIWLIFSFFIFLFILWNFGRPALLKMLDNKIEQIKKEIETAESLKIEAQELLAQYQRKHRDSVEQAEQIILTAEKNVEEIKKRAAEELKEDIERKEQQLRERISRAENAAIEEIKAYATELAISATAEIINDKLDKKTSQKLVDSSISNIGHGFN